MYGRSQSCHASAGGNLASQSDTFFLPVVRFLRLMLNPADTRVRFPTATRSCAHYWTPQACSIAAIDLDLERESGKLPHQDSRSYAPTSLSRAGPTAGGFGVYAPFCRACQCCITQSRERKGVPNDDLHCYAHYCKVRRSVPALRSDYFSD